MATNSSVASSPSDDRLRGVLRVGLTGGIGSGKSVVAADLQSLGAALIDTDAIAHALTAPGGAAMPAIEAQFGPAFVTADGALDRTRMREHAFHDGSARKRLESILHPLIRAQAETAARKAATTAPYLVFAVPLLVEAGDWHDRYHRVLVVDCAASTQIERVQKRSNIPEATIRSIIAQQATRVTRLRAATDVVVNESSFEALRARCARLHALYRGLASAPRATQPL